MDQQDPKTLDPAAWIAWASMLTATGRYFFRGARPTQFYPKSRAIRRFRLKIYSWEDQGKVYWQSGRSMRGGGHFAPAQWARSVSLWEHLPDGTSAKRSPAELVDLPPAWVLERVPEGGSGA